MQMAYIIPEELKLAQVFSAQREHCKSWLTARNDRYEVAAV